VRPDPSVIADHAASVEAPLQISLATNEHTCPEFKGFRILEPDTGLYAQPCATPSHQAVPKHTSHQGIKHAIAVNKSAVEFP